MRASIVLLAVLGLAAAVSAADVYKRTARYDGERVFRCQWTGDRTTDNAMYRLIQDFNIDIWGRTAEHIDIRVRPAQASSMVVHAFLQHCSILHEDVEALIAANDAQLLAQRAKVAKGQADWFEAYHTYEEIREWYEDLAAQYPTMATYIPTIGKTIEGRDQFAFKFTSERGSADKLKIFFQCQIHAREWISGATCGYVINELLARYGQQQNITTLLDSLEFVVIPIQNPDGYVHTWNEDRLWRKNRNPNTGGCAGVDVNRNYNDHWGQGGSSSAPCSDTYMGSAPNSELETKNSIAFFKENGPIIGAIDWHSYSQLILRPYGWTRQDSPDEDQLKAIGDAMADAIYATTGTRYTSQKSIELYTTTGTASDWFYGEEATATNGGYRAAGYTIELRDTGRYGFQLPPEQIIPTGQESLSAVIVFASELLANPILA